MDALSLLLNRSSHPVLKEPAPQGEALDNILNAGLRAPDHAGIAPWQFYVLSGDGLVKLGQIFEKAAKESGMADKDVARAPQLPLRAPLMIVACCRYKPHPKVPRQEQIASTSCAIHSMQMAALAQGFSGVWRTGSYAVNPVVKEAFELNEQDEITGFLYLGTPENPVVKKQLKSIDNYVEFWG